jgi:hypothetical protein
MNYFFFLEKQEMKIIEARQQFQRNYLGIHPAHKNHQFLKE